MQESYEDILQAFVGLYNQLESLTDKKILLMQFVDQVEQIKWRGLPLIVERISEDILMEERSGLIYAILARIFAKEFPDKARKLAEEVDANVNVLFEWEFDAAIAYALLCEGFFEVGDLENAKKYLDLSVKYALKIPDRSDRSIALARIIPKIYELYGFEATMGYLEKITYEVKRSEAIVNLIRVAMGRDGIIDIKMLLPYVPKEKRSYIISEWFLAIAKRSPQRAVEYVRQLTQYIKADSSGIDHLRTLVNLLHIYLMGDGALSNPEISELYNRIKSLTFQNLHKREFIAIVFDLVDILLKFKLKNEAQKLLSEMRSYMSNDDPSSEIFAFNKLSKIYAKYGYFNDVNLFIHNCLELLGSIETAVRTPLIVESLSSILYVINEFPPEVPVSLAENYARRIRPIEVTEVKIKLFKENLAYLREAYKDMSIDKAINEVIREFRMFNINELEAKAKNILMSLLEKRDGSYVLNYILKYAYEINIPEAKRLEILELLGSAASALLKQDIERAKEYVELTIREFERRKVSLLPILLRYLGEYLLMMLP